jgi:hypothetical protein
MELSLMNMIIDFQTDVDRSELNSDRIGRANLSLADYVVIHSTI